MTRQYAKRLMALAVTGAVLVGAVVIPVRAAKLESDKVVATEQPVEGANVVVDQYCDNVADGQVAAMSSELLVASENENTEDAASGQAVEAESTQPEHVELNLNYSRLGIASKVDTYLNVRKKPSKDAKIVGKMTKNAGCHIYKIKKGWAKIVSGKVTGWVKASYLETDEKAEELATKVGKDVVEIQTDSLRVRALPTTDAPIYSVVSEGEEFTIKKADLTLDYVKKIIEKEDVSKKALKRAGGEEKIANEMSNFVCIYVDDEYAFVSKDYVKQRYSLKRAVAAKTVKASKSSGVSSSQASIVEYAKQFLGNRYVWGGSSLTHGTDCSGFTMSLYAHYGYSLPHHAASQAAQTRSVSSPKPGDLFFYSNGGGINHVAMYIGGGMVIHASNPSDGIKISNAYYRHPVKIGRVMN